MPRTRSRRRISRRNRRTRRRTQRGGIYCTTSANTCISQPLNACPQGTSECDPDAAPVAAPAATPAPFQTTKDYLKAAGCITDGNCYDITDCDSNKCQVITVPAIIKGVRKPWRVRSCCSNQVADSGCIGADANACEANPECELSTNGMWCTKKSTAVSEGGRRRSRRRRSRRRRSNRRRTQRGGECEQCLECPCEGYSAAGHETGCKPGGFFITDPLEFDKMYDNQQECRNADEGIDTDYKRNVLHAQAGVPAGGRRRSRRNLRRRRSNRRRRSRK